MYERGYKALKEILRELGRVRRGPYPVISHSEDGTVTIWESPCVTDDVNIRRVVRILSLESNIAIGGECRDIALEGISFVLGAP